MYLQILMKIENLLFIQSGEIDIFYFTIGFKIKPSLNKYLSIILPEKEISQNQM